MRTFAINTATNFILENDYEFIISNVGPYDPTNAIFVSINNNDPINNGMKLSAGGSFSVKLKAGTLISVEGLKYVEARASLTGY